MGERGVDYAICGHVWYFKNVLSEFTRPAMAQKIKNVTQFHKKGTLGSSETAITFFFSPSFHFE